MWLLPFFVGIKRHIADVSWLPTDEAVILTTRQKHQFSSKYIPVVFRDTGLARQLQGKSDDQSNSLWSRTSSIGQRGQTLQV
eukprot:g33512.t1